MCRRVPKPRLKGFDDLLAQIREPLIEARNPVTLGQFTAVEAKYPMLAVLTLCSKQLLNGHGDLVRETNVPASIAVPLQQVVCLAGAVIFHGFEHGIEAGGRDPGHYQGDSLLPNADRN